MSRFLVIEDQGVGSVLCNAAVIVEATSPADAAKIANEYVGEVTVSPIGDSLSIVQSGLDKCMFLVGNNDSSDVSIFVWVIDLSTALNINIQEVK